MNRRDFLAAGAATLMWPPVAAGQSKMRVVGLLWNDSLKPSPYASVLMEALRGKGYVEGKNIRFDDRVALDGYDLMTENAAALARARVDLIVTFGATATIAAAKATREIPVVAVTGADPVAAGLAASLSRPGGNVTGVTTITSGLTGKRIELLRDLVPGLSRIGLLFAADSARLAVTTREAENIARTLKLQPHVALVRRPDEIEAAIETLSRSRVGAIYVSGNTMLSAHASGVVGAIAKRRLPAIYSVDTYAQAGGLIVYAPAARKAFMRLADYIDRILRGARPGDLPIEQTSEVELVINLRAAREIGVRFPQSILQRADRAFDA